LLYSSDNTLDKLREEADEHLRSGTWAVFLALDGNEPIGFIALKIHNQYTADIFNLGILEQYHRQGIGRKLLHAAEQYCRDNGYFFLTVKTLDALAELENTLSMDGGGIDLWRGTGGDFVDAIICTVDLMKRDSEIKILIGCSEEEKRLVLETHNNSEYMKGILIRRELDD